MLLEDLQHHEGPVELILAGDFLDVLRMEDADGGDPLAATLARPEYRRLFAMLRAFAGTDGRRVRNVGPANRTPPDLNGVGQRGAEVGRVVGMEAAADAKRVSASSPSISSTPAGRCWAVVVAATVLDADRADDAGPGGRTIAGVYPLSEVPGVIGWWPGSGFGRSAVIRRAQWAA
jgi:hypothetical protein